ncbi:MAG TPA: HepT-like ribonuclease domain-containing protein [Candidatus Limnocylindrales bacterium]|nr:HepT-like ribonuclease domain-containing protein [Candidatus Limnocylindrales bacterium]
MLLDILIAARHVSEFTANMSQPEFEADRKTHGAVMHEFTVMGEAARLLSAEAKARHSHIDWRSVTGMRSVLVHEYFAIDFDVLWDAVEHDIPPLILHLEQIVPPDSQDTGLE